MADRRYDPRVVPGSVADARSRAFAEVMGLAMEERDFVRLLFERIERAPVEALPCLIREFGLADFVQPGMNEALVRDLLRGSFDLHASMGYIHGIRRGLALIGISVESWQQWFQQDPPAPPGTHVARLSIGAEVFTGEGRAITTRLQASIAAMVARMQRASQFIALRFRAEASTPVFAAMVVRGRMTIRPGVDPISVLKAAGPLFAGMAVASRIRISPRAP